MAGDALTHIEFQKELQRHGIDERHAFVFTMLYERLLDTEKMVLDMAGIVSGFADQLLAFVKLSEADAKQIAELQKKLGLFGKTPGVDVRSEPIDNQ